jgi:formate dehydrogenase major subunit/NADH-quinone oxidoreductase subunit G
MKTVSLTINGKEIKARKGDKVLWTALNNDIYIPNLCALSDAPHPAASCRLCWVEVEGKKQPVTACTQTVEQGMVVNTRGGGALRLARTALELLLASNVVNCAHCLASGSCELQKIAAHLGVKLKTKRFRKILRNLPLDSSSPLFIYDPNKCVLCGRCIWVCRERLGIGELGFAHRGFNRRLTTFGDEPIGESRCEGCGDCVTACPTGALCFKDKTDS